MKLLTAIGFGYLLTINIAFAEQPAEETANQQTLTTENQAEQERQLAEKRAATLNKKMEAKIGEMNDIMQQQISIRFGFELEE